MPDQGIIVTLLFLINPMKISTPIITTPFQKEIFKIKRPMKEEMRKASKQASKQAKYLFAIGYIHNLQNIASNSDQFSKIKSEK